MSEGKPAKPPPKPKNLKFSRALFAYQAKENDELSFKEDDILFILDDKSDPDWWRARCHGKEGLVPANFLSGGNKKQEQADEETDEVSLNPLHDACRRGNLELLEDCLLNRVPVNAPDCAGNAPIHCAAHSGQVDALKRLLTVPVSELEI